MSYSGAARYYQNQFARQTGVGIGHFFTHSFSTKTGLVRITYVFDANVVSELFWFEASISRDSVGISSKVLFESNAANENQQGKLTYIDNPGPGSYTYGLWISDQRRTIDFGETNGPVLILEDLGGG